MEGSKPHEKGTYHVKRPKPEKCRNCPYGRDSPCIGWCTKKILQELGLWETRFK